ncbi:MAG: hypothetical protein QW303_08635 [Nitrososphaerota archaeon]
MRLGVFGFSEEFARSFLFVTIVSGQNLILPGIDLYAYEIQLPGINWDQVMLNIRFGKFFIPGRQTMDELRMSVYGVASNVQMSDSIYNLHVISQQLDTARIEPLMITCSILNTNGSSMKDLRFSNAYLKSFSFGQMSWNRNEILDMELSFYVNKFIRS